MCENVVDFAPHAPVPNASKYESLRKNFHANLVTAEIGKFINPLFDMRYDEGIPKANDVASVYSEGTETMQAFQIFDSAALAHYLAGKRYGSVEAIDGKLKGDFGMELRRMCSKHVADMERKMNDTMKRMKPNSGQ